MADHHRITTDAAQQLPYNIAMQTLAYYHHQNRYQHIVQELMKIENETKGRK